MKVSKIKFIFYLALVTAPFIFCATDSVLAKAWWGDGYKTSKWVLRHGGTIVRFKFKNISGESSEYKAVMFDKKDKYVEKEYGKEGLFDDAKDGVYTIKAYRGGTSDRTTYKGGKSFVKIEVVARPGETLVIEFDYKKKKAKIVDSYFKYTEDLDAKPVPRPAPKPAPIPVIISDSTVPLASASVSNDEATPGVVEPAEEPVNLELEEEKSESNPEPEIEIVQEEAVGDASNYFNKTINEIDEDIALAQEESRNIFRKIWENVRSFLAKE